MRASVGAPTGSPGTLHPQREERGSGLSGSGGGAVLVGAGAGGGLVFVGFGAGVGCLGCAGIGLWLPSPLFPWPE